MSIKFHLPDFAVHYHFNSFQAHEIRSDLGQTVPVVFKQTVVQGHQLRDQREEDVRRKEGGDKEISPFCVAYVFLPVRLQSIVQWDPPLGLICGAFPGTPRPAVSAGSGAVGQTA